MKIRSLGYRTDLFFPVFDGQVIDRGEYLAIKTPSNPLFYWGNYLLFSRPPANGDFSYWFELFIKEIGSASSIKHKAFGWDSPKGEVGEIGPFIQAGFHLVENTVLVSQAPHPPARKNLEVAVRTLQTDKDWDQALANQIACREAGFSEKDYFSFKKPQMQRYKCMVAAGLGNWYGAFIGFRLVADLGIFHQAGLGRYQSVGTHPDFRRKGIAATLVYKSALLAEAEFKLNSLVIVAEEDSSAARIYQSVGFDPVEKQLGLEWWQGI